MMILMRGGKGLIKVKVKGGCGWENIIPEEIIVSR